MTSRIKPILFNTETVSAILDGHKTVTRRVVKNAIFKQWADVGFSDDAIKNPENKMIDLAPYQVGDILWVRETWSTDTSGNYVYRTNYGETEDDTFPPSMFKWKPSIHMPKEAARIFLKVTDVRVERLQDITEAQAIAEGIVDGGCLSCGKSEPCNCENSMPDPVDAFAYLWHKIHGDCGENSWTRNPWVWVIEFERVEVPQ